MSWWPWGERVKAERAGRIRQSEQIGQSITRIQEEGIRKVESAQADLSHAAEGAKAAIGRRIEGSSQVRAALKTLIDRKTDGRFELEPEVKRGR